MGQVIRKINSNHPFRNPRGCDSACCQQKLKKNDPIPIPTASTTTNIPQQKGGCQDSGCKSGKCHSSSSSLPKLQTFADRQAHRAKIRKATQWGRRGNHVLQNVLAAVWAWSIPESQLRIWYDDGMYYMLWLFHIMQFLGIIAFLWASCTEPGFLENPSSKNKKDKNNVLKECTMNNGADHEKVSLLSDVEGGSKRSDDIDLESGNVTKINLRKDVPMSYCRNCEFLRPIRAKHCYICDRCVPRFDHHCPMVQQCIGANNYRQFYLLCVTYSIVSGWSLFMAKDLIFSNPRWHSDEVTTLGWIWRTGLFLWMLWQTFAAVSLSIMHSYFICTAQTTYEFLKPNKLSRRIEYERERGRFMDIASKRKKSEGFCGMMTSMLVNNGGGLFLCYYPFSEGLIRNWYGFLTAQSLERNEYFETGRTVLIHPPNEKGGHISVLNGSTNGAVESLKNGLTATTLS